MSTSRIWEFRSESGHVAGTDLVGFHVEATDGPIGKVDKHSEEVGASHLVVDTGPWIFGTRVLLPAVTVARVDQHEKKVYVDRTKDEIKNAPAFDPSHGSDADYRAGYNAYYGPFYVGPFL